MWRSEPPHERPVQGFACRKSITVRPLFAFLYPAVSSQDSLPVARELYGSAIYEFLFPEISLCDETPQDHKGGAGATSRHPAPRRDESARRPTRGAAPTVKKVTPRPLR